MQPVEAQILLIWDDKANAAGMQQQLAGLGHDIRCAGNLDKALRLIVQHPFNALVIGHHPPEQNGLALLMEITSSEATDLGDRRLPAVIVVAGAGIAPADHVKLAVKAVKAGAADYLVADSVDFAQCLAQAIAVTMDCAPLAAKLRGPANDTSPQGSSEGQAAAAPLQDRHFKQVLSPRENECLRWSASGNNTASIAYTLGVSERTVRFHISNAMSKLEATSRSHAIARAMQLGLLHL